MADNDQYGDEYHFSDLDVTSPDSQEEEHGATASDSITRVQGEEGRKNIRRNALILVGIIVLIMLASKFIGSFFSEKSQKTANKASVPSLTATQPKPIPQIAPVAPVQTPQAVVEQPNSENIRINQKLSALELGQQNMQTEVNSVSNQLNSINTNVNDLTEKIAALNQMVTELASKVDRQSNEIAILTERTKPPKPVRKIVVRRPIRLIYFIQAVIPGRAWLIATNGSTLTVREGTHIAGYGIVKLIDPIQGRVVTSSGQVIRFSQQDS